MGSRIGDYVHYHVINYQTYGTNRVTPSISAAAAVTEQAEHVRRSIAEARQHSMSKQDHDKLLRILQTFMKPLQDPSQYLEGESAEEYNEIWSILMEFFLAEFDKAAEDVYRDTLNILGNPLVNGLTKIKPKKTAKQIQAKTLQSRIDLIYNAIQEGRKNSSLYTEKQLQQITDAYNHIIKEKQKLEEAGIDALKRLDISDPKHRVNPLINLEDAQGLIKAINKARRLSASTANLEKGTLFEYLIAVAPLIGKKLTGRALREAILAAIGGAGPFSVEVASLGQAHGQDRTSVTFDKDSFLNLSDDQWSRIFAKNNYHLNDHLYIANTPSQNKVDVTLAFSPDQEPIRISAKNVNLTGRFASVIHLVRDMSFLSALTNMKSHEFVNHYLNQHVSHVPYSLVHMYQASENILNLSLLEQAWRGYKPGQDKADVFVINNNMTGKVQIFTIGDLLSDIYDSGSIGEICKIDPYVAGITIPMYWSKTGAYDRITQVLAKVHSIKVSIGLYPSLFTGNA